MNRGDSGVYVEFLRELRRLEAKLPEHSLTDIRWVRSLGFALKGRDDIYARMVEDLIEKVTPLAITERLTE